VRRLERMREREDYEGREKGRGELKERVTWRGEAGSGGGSKGGRAGEREAEEVGEERRGGMGRGEKRFRYIRVCLCALCKGCTNISCWGFGGKERGWEERVLGFSV